MLEAGIAQNGLPAFWWSSWQEIRECGGESERPPRLSTAQHFGEGDVVSIEVCSEPWKPQATVDFTYLQETLLRFGPAWACGRWRSYGLTTWRSG